MQNKYLNVSHNSCDQQIYEGVYVDVVALLEVWGDSIKYDDCILENKVFENKIDILEFILQDIMIARF